MIKLTREECYWIAYNEFMIRSILVERQRDIEKISRASHIFAVKHTEEIYVKVRNDTKHLNNNTIFGKRINVDDNIISTDLKLLVQEILGGYVTWVEKTPHNIIVHHDSERYLCNVTKFTYSEFLDKFYVDLRPDKPIIK